MRHLHEGIAENLPENIRVLSKTLKAGLRNSWWETALKMERFLDSESKNQLTQREKSSGFLVMCQWCSIFRAVSRLEFLRSAAAFLKGHGCSPGGFRLSLYGASPSAPKLKLVAKSRFWKIFVKVFYVSLTVKVLIAILNATR